MKNCINKCCITIFLILSLIIGFVLLANLKPDYLKQNMSTNFSNFVDALNFTDEPEVQETYIKKERRYIEPSAFE